MVEACSCSVPSRNADYLKVKPERQREILDILIEEKPYAVTLN